MPGLSGLVGAWGAWDGEGAHQSSQVLSELPRLLGEGGVLNGDGAASPPKALIGAGSVLNYEGDHQPSQGCQGC